jgi:hypothetical protein
MIDKFNFYDVYGYLIPGAALLLLLWLPFALVHTPWPTKDLGSAVIGVVVAYIAGHLLQMICTRVIPSSVAIGADKHPRYPSDVVLDAKNSSFSLDLKKKLETRVQEKFSLNIGVEQAESEALDQLRRDAFFLARHALIRAKEVSYAEQFEGMYTLARGLAAALAVACVNYLGWSLSILHRDWLDCVVIVVITVTLLAAANFTAHVLRKDLGTNTVGWLDRLSALSLLLAALALGYGMGRHHDVTPAQAGEIVLCAIAAFVGCVRSYGAYKSFSYHFAVTIWRDFYASTDKQPPASQLDV